MSRLNTKNLVLTYLYNRTVTLEQDLDLKRQFIRYHRCDEIDYIEVVIAKARADLINEVNRDIMSLLKIVDDNGTNYTK